jgi:hypothetical protein
MTDALQQFPKIPDKENCKASTPRKFRLESLSKHNSSNPEVDRAR